LYSVQPKEAGMKQGTRTIVTLGIASVFALSVGMSTVWANEPGYYKEGYGSGGHGSMGGYGAGMMHNSTSRLIRHLLKHEQNIGPPAEQVTKLKDKQHDLDKTSNKSEDDNQVAEHELKDLNEEEKSN